MGSASSHHKQPRPTAVSKIIDKQIKKDDVVEKRILKLLLLGTGESGKSTVLKQMRILLRDGFTEEQLKDMKPLIYSNIINSIVNIVAAMDMLKIRFSDPELEVKYQMVHHTVALKLEMLPLSRELVDAVKLLWADDGVQECYLQRNKYHLQESAKYFLDDVDRICSPLYKPTYQDALCVRTATIGISQLDFSANNTDFQVYDVGGQRSERRKWMHHFDNVNGIIYICAMSEYDQVLVEDYKVNRIRETLYLFGTLINCEYFAKTSVILFLNKRDVFAEKIKKTFITSVFPEYIGEHTYEKAVRFISLKFQELNKNQKRAIKVYETCATDTNQVTSIIHGTITMIIKQNAKDAGVV